MIPTKHLTLYSFYFPRKKNILLEHNSLLPIHNYLLPEHIFLLPEDNYNLPEYNFLYHVHDLLGMDYYRYHIDLKSQILVHKLFFIIPMKI